MDYPAPRLSWSYIICHRGVLLHSISVFLWMSPLSLCSTKELRFLFFSTPPSPYLSIPGLFSVSLSLLFSLCLSQVLFTKPRCSVAEGSLGNIVLPLWMAVVLIYYLETQSKTAVFHVINVVFYKGLNSETAK